MSDEFGQTASERAESAARYARRHAQPVSAERRAAYRDAVAALDFSAYEDEVREWAVLSQSAYRVRG